jgi:hypothetical protein
MGANLDGRTDQYALARPCTTCSPAVRLLFIPTPRWLSASISTRHHRHSPKPGQSWLTLIRCWPAAWPKIPPTVTPRASTSRPRCVRRSPPPVQRRHSRRAVLLKLRSRPTYPSVLRPLCLPTPSPRCRDRPPLRLHRPEPPLRPGTASTPPRGSGSSVAPRRACCDQAAATRSSWFATLSITSNDRLGGHCIPPRHCWCRWSVHLSMTCHRRRRNSFRSALTKWVWVGRLEASGEVSFVRSGWKSPPRFGFGSRVGGV